MHVVAILPTHAEIRLTCFPPLPGLCPQSQRQPAARKHHEGPAGAKTSLKGVPIRTEPHMAANPASEAEVSGSGSNEGLGLTTATLETRLHHILSTTGENDTSHRIPQTVDHPYDIKTIQRQLVRLTSQRHHGDGYSYEVRHSFCSHTSCTLWYREYHRPYSRRQQPINWSYPCAGIE